jgi:hypothetical protein
MPDGDFVRLSGPVTSKAAGTSLDIPVDAAGHALGNTVFVGTGQLANGAASGVTDSKGNTYTEIYNEITDNPRSGMWFSVLTTALVSGDTITVTYGTTQNRGQVHMAGEYVGAATLDSPAVEASGSGNTLDSGNKTPAAAPAVAIGYLTATGETGDLAPSGSWTQRGYADTGTAGATATNMMAVFMDQALANTNPVAATGTSTANSAWSAGIAVVTFGASAVVVDTSAARVALRGAATTLDLGATTVDTTAARLGLRAAVTTVDLAVSIVDTAAARLAFRAGVSSIVLGAATIGTAAARLALRAAVTTVQAAGGSVTVDTLASHVALRSAVSSVDTAAATVDTLAGRFALRAGATSVDAGGWTVNTAAARLVLRSGATSLVLGATFVDTVGGRFALRSAVTSAIAAQSVVDTVAARLALRAGTTDIVTGGGVVTTAAARVALRAAVSSVVAGIPTDMVVVIGSLQTQWATGSMAQRWNPGDTGQRWDLGGLRRT